MKRNKTLLQEESPTAIPTSDNDRPASESDFEMLEPIDSFTVPSQLMTSRAKSDPVRNKLLSSPSNIRNERRSQKGCSPQPPPRSATTNASPYVTPCRSKSSQRITSFVVSHPSRSHSPPQRRMQLRSEWNPFHSRNTLNFIFSLYMKSDSLGLKLKARSHLLLQQIILPILQPHRSKKSVSSCHMVHLKTRAKTEWLCPQPVTCTWK